MVVARCFELDNSSSGSIWRRVIQLHGAIALRMYQDARSRRKASLTFGDALVKELLQSESESANSKVNGEQGGF